MLPVPVLSLLVQGLLPLIHHKQTLCAMDALHQNEDHGHEQQQLPPADDPEQLSPEDQGHLVEEDHLEEEAEEDSEEEGGEG